MSVTRNEIRDRKSTRLNSSHSQISYAVFCLKKKIRHFLSASTVDTRFVFAAPAGRCDFERKPVPDARPEHPQCAAGHSALPYRDTFPSSFGSWRVERLARS